MQNVRHLLRHLRRELAHLGQSLDRDHLVLFAQVVQHQRGAPRIEVRQHQRNGLRVLGVEQLAQLLGIGPLQLAPGCPARPPASAAPASADRRRAACRRSPSAAGWRSPGRRASSTFWVSSSLPELFKNLCGRHLRRVTRADRPAPRSAAAHPLPAERAESPWPILRPPPSAARLPCASRSRWSIVAASSQLHYLVQPRSKPPRFALVVAFSPGFRAGSPVCYSE